MSARLLPIAAAAMLMALGGCSEQGQGDKPVAAWHAAQSLFSGD